jgi:hypothetical protein
MRAFLDEPTPNNSWSGPLTSCGAPPRAPEDGVRPRRLSSASGRLLNFTVRPPDLVRDKM